MHLAPSIWTWGSQKTKLNESNLTWRQALGRLLRRGLRCDLGGVCGRLRGDVGGGRGGDHDGLRRHEESGRPVLTVLQHRGRGRGLRGGGGRRQHWTRHACHHHRRVHERHPLQMLGLVLAFQH